FWPVWRWYVHRLSDQSDEAWGVVALITAVLFAFQRKPGAAFLDREGERGTRGMDGIGGIFSSALWLPAALLLCYALSYHFISPLPRAAIAMTAIAATVSAIRFGQGLHFGVWGLLLLALPVVASLQFYLGFPMRALIARLAAPMLQANGFAVVAEGASLNWNGDPILIDAPCSGVKMLWTGFYLTFTLACHYKLNAKRTALTCMAAFAAIIIGNTFRAAALFYVEAGAVNLPLPDWTHEGVGVVIFAATAIAIAWAAQRIAKTDHISYVASSSSLFHHLLPDGRGRAFRADAIGRDE
ncbi:MAG TPA: archaeosortase/exosortase family protein, partial [Blastocatellia bacterium]